MAVAPVAGEDPPPQLAYRIARRCSLFGPGQDADSLYAGDPAWELLRSPTVPEDGFEPAKHRWVPDPVDGYALAAFIKEDGDVVVLKVRGAYDDLYEAAPSPRSAHGYPSDLPSWEASGGVSTCSVAGGREGVSSGDGGDGGGEPTSTGRSCGHGRPLPSLGRHRPPQPPHSLRTRTHLRKRHGSFDFSVQSVFSTVDLQELNCPTKR